MYKTIHSKAAECTFFSSALGNQEKKTKVQNQQKEGHNTDQTEIKWKLEKKKKTAERINETKSWFLKMVSTINKPLAILTEKKKRDSKL